MLSPQQGKVIPASNYQCPAAPEPVVIWVKIGSATVQLSDTSVPLHHDEGLWLPSGTPYQVAGLPDSVVLLLQLPSDEAFTGGPHWFHTNPAAAAAVIFLFSQQLAYLRHDDQLFRQLARALLRQAVPLEQFPPTLSQPTRPISRRLQHLATLIHQDPTMTIADLATAAMMSSRNLQRRWREETGLTLGSWQRQYRLQLAARSLANNPSVALAASQGHFESASGFIRAFTKATGQTPGQFAQQIPHDLAPAGSTPLPAAALSPQWQSPAHRTWPRINATHVAIWVYRGSCTATLGNRTITVKEGESLIIPAGSPNSLEMPPGAIVLPAGYAPVAAVQIDAEAVIPRPLNVAEDYLFHCLTATYTPLRPAGHHPSEGLALLAGTPVARLSMTGVHLHNLQLLSEDRYVARLNHAREILAAGATVSEAAKEVGYANVSSLTRAFRRRYGMTPSDYANSLASQADWRRHRRLA